jgi:hypothetical protein
MSKEKLARVGVKGTLHRIGPMETARRQSVNEYIEKIARRIRTGSEIRKAVRVLFNAAQNGRPKSKKARKKKVGAAAELLKRVGLL